VQARQGFIDQYYHNAIRKWSLCHIRRGRPGPEDLHTKPYAALAHDQIRITACGVLAQSAAPMPGGGCASLMSATIADPPPLLPASPYLNAYAGSQGL